MNFEDSPRPAKSVAANRVSLSAFVNERFPDWEEILSAHDVARLTRRPPWMIQSLALLGRLPRKHRFRGRRIGWLRSEVIQWLLKDLRATPHKRLHTLGFHERIVRQASLPFEGVAPLTRRGRGRDLSS